MHWQFGEMKFGEMKRNTSNWSNFGILLRRAGLTASAGLSCKHNVERKLEILTYKKTVAGFCSSSKLQGLNGWMDGWMDG